MDVRYNLHTLEHELGGLHISDASLMRLISETPPADQCCSGVNEILGGVRSVSSSCRSSMFQHLSEIVCLWLRGTASTSVKGAGQGDGVAPLTARQWIY